MKKRKNILQKGMALLLSAVMAVALVPVTAGGPVEVKASPGSEPAVKTISGLGTGTIGEPASTDEGWAGGYVYYGKYNGSSVKYRVLSKSTTDFGKVKNDNNASTMLLDCDTALYEAQFHSDISNSWRDSELQTNLNASAFLSKEGVFTTQEKEAIASSYTNNGIAPYSDYKYSVLTGEKIFVLDATEAANSAYGYTNDMTRIKDGATSSGWWLRSPIENDNEGAGFVDGEYGDIYAKEVDQPVGVSPAFNLNLSSVLFSSVISSDLNAYKLTIIDPKLNINLTSGSKVTQSGTTLTIPYTVDGNNKTNAAQVSVLVTNQQILKDGKIDVSQMATANQKGYGKLTITSGNVTGSGTGTFTLPDGLTGTLENDYHIYLLAEDVNGEKETDYASLPVEIKASDIGSGGPTAKTGLVYNGTDQALLEGPDTYSYSLTQDGTYTDTVPTGKKAGTYTVYYKESASAASQSLDVTIAQKEVTVTGIKVTNKTFDKKKDAVLDFTGVTFTSQGADALVSGDDLSLTATGTYADEKVGDNKTVTISNLALAGADAGNYKLAESGNQTEARGAITKTEQGTSVDMGSGKLETEVVVEKDVPASQVTGLTKDFAESVLTEDEKTEVEGGETLLLYLDISNIQETVKESDKSLVESKAKEFASDAKVGMYLDLTLMKKIGNKESQVTDFKGKKLSVTFTVPDGLKAPAGVTRTFAVIRIHNGKADQLAATTGMTISIETDRLSTYSLVYKDVRRSSGTVVNGDLSPSPTVSPSPSPVPPASPAPSPTPAASPAPSPSPAASPAPSLVPTASPVPAVETSPTEADRAAAEIAINAGLKLKRTGSAATVSWGQAEQADSYEVYAVYYGGDKFEKVLSLGADQHKAVIRKMNGKKLKANKELVVYVAACRNVNGTSVRLARSLSAAAAGSQNKKYTNVKRIKLSKTAYSLQKGKTAKIKAKLVLEDPSKKPLPAGHMARLRYASDAPAVATVSKKGKIKAQGQGTCQIYVYAANGNAKKVKVTVK